MDGEWGKSPTGRAAKTKQQADAEKKKQEHTRTAAKARAGEK